VNTLRDYSSFMPRLRWIALLVAIYSLGAPSIGSAFPLWGSGDPLSQRDGWGRLHQSRELDEPDYAKREWWRLFYYNKPRELLMQDPAYVGAMQVALRRYGYYCGPIDGIYSSEMTDAIARLQKNHGMRVSGNLTVPVRRALHLP
jgi:Putative peptidoglycan binding domain